MKASELVMGKDYRTKYDEEFKFLCFADKDCDVAVGAKYCFLDKVWDACELATEEIKEEWKEIPIVEGACAPPWARWIAMDVNRLWYWFVEKPTLGSHRYYLNKKAPSQSPITGIIPKNYWPKFSGDWQDSLTPVNNELAEEKINLAKLQKTR